MEAQPSTDRTKLQALIQEWQAVSTPDLVASLGREAFQSAIKFLGNPENTLDFINDQNAPYFKARFNVGAGKSSHIGALINQKVTDLKKRLKKIAPPLNVVVEAALTSTTVGGSRSLHFLQRS